jgi:hypothetical protein
MAFVLSTDCNCTQYRLWKIDFAPGAASLDYVYFSVDLIEKVGFVCFRNGCENIASNNILY